MCLFSPGGKKKFIHCLYTNYSFPMKYFPAVINYKSCTLQTDSSPVPVCSICFCLCFHFSMPAHFVKWIFFLFLSLSLSCTLSPHFTFSFCLSCVGPFKSSPCILNTVPFLIYGFLSSFAVYFLVPFSFALSLPHISLCSEFCTVQPCPTLRSLQLFEVLLIMLAFSFGVVEYMQI